MYNGIGKGIYFLEVNTVPAMLEVGSVSNQFVQENSLFSHIINAL